VPFKYVTIAPGDDTLGHVEMYKPPDFDPQLDGPCRVRQWIEKNIMVNYAGAVAVKKVLKRMRVYGTGGDDFRSLNISSYSFGSPESSDAFLKWMYLRTADIFEFEHIQAAVHALARELLERKKINRRDAVDIIRDAIDAHARGNSQ
jgi:hypothetical protein